MPARRSVSSFLTNTLQTRKQQEIDDIGTVLDELEKAIQSELKKGEQPEQLSLFTEDERTQLSATSPRWKRASRASPSERRMETQAIESRYAKLDDRTFPVAVIFVVPESTSGVAK
jgi:DNA-binding transcriptional regulator GbsR (MarR family)